MSLSRALSTLSPDQHAEHVLRDILTLFTHHPREWLTEAGVLEKTGHTRLEVHPILHALASSYVLENEPERGYRFSGDIVLTFEIDSFMRRVEYHQSHIRTNVARFRERQGY